MTRPGSPSPFLPTRHPDSGLLIAAHSLCGVVLGASLLLLIAGCDQSVVLDENGDLVDDAMADYPGVDDDDDHDHPAGPLNPDTLNVEEHPCFEYARVLTDDRSELEFGYSCDAGPDELQSGLIVWGLQDGGYLRRIQSVEVEGTTAYLTTEFASLAETVTDVDFDETVDFEERRTIEFSGRVLDEVEVEGGTSKVVVDRGVLNMQPSINARGSFGFLRLKSVTSRNRITMGIDLDATFTSDGPTDRAQIVELDTYSHPFTLRIGPVRVRGQLNGTVKLGFVHESDGPIDVSTSFSGNGVIEMGGTYYMPNSWSPYWNPNFTGTVTELTPEGEGDWGGRVYLIIEGTVVVDGVEGGTSFYELSSDSSVTADCDGSTWETSGGLKGQTNMKLRVMGRSVNHTFPELGIEADSKTGEASGVTPVGGCGDDDPVDDDFGICEPVAELSCGQAITGDTSSDAAAASMDAYPCNVGNYDSPELVYSWTATSSTAEFSLLNAEPTEINHDLFVLDGGAGECSAAACVAHGFNSVEFDAIPGRTYYLVVDGFWEEMGPFQAELTCD